MKLLSLRLNVPFWVNVRIWKFWSLGIALDWFGPACSLSGLNYAACFDSGDLPPWPELAGELPVLTVHSCRQQMWLHRCTVCPLMRLLVLHVCLCSWQHFASFQECSTRHIMSPFVWQFILGDHRSWKPANVSEIIVQRKTFIGNFYQHGTSVLRYISS